MRRRYLVAGLGALGAVLAAGPVMADAPALPAGLGGSAPALPAGLGGGEAAGFVPENDRSASFELPESMNAFWEARAGRRVRSDPYEKRGSIGETRLQLEFERAEEDYGLKIVTDFLYDPVLDEHSVDIKKGRGAVDLRQANLMLRPLSFMDLRLGRQVNTWGTGDMLFINDLFPKDWNSYFIGRDDDYLKAPSDSLKASLFGDWVNLDIIYSPRFDSDRYIDGRRVSFWNAGAARRSGRDMPVEADLPSSTFSDDEWAARLYRNAGSFELALYGYDGFWKSPGGMDPESGRAIFPKLQSYGASLRGPLGRGIVNLEAGWYRSRDDRDGDNPFVNNSELRWLVGYEQELARDLTGGFQYYVENMRGYGAYKRTLPDGMEARDEYRHVLTLRLTQLMMSQNLTLGLFVYWSPSDHDTFARPKVNYKIDDHWTAEIGGNVFRGSDKHTFFGQFERNSNVYASLRYGF